MWCIITFSLESLQMLQNVIHFGEGWCLYRAAGPQICNCLHTLLKKQKNATKICWNFDTTSSRRIFPSLSADQTLSLTLSHMGGGNSTNIQSSSLNNLSSLLWICRTSFISALLPVASTKSKYSCRSRVAWCTFSELRTCQVTYVPSWYDMPYSIPSSPCLLWHSKSGSWSRSTISGNVGKEGGLHELGTERQSVQQCNGMLRTSDLRQNWSLKTTWGDPNFLTASTKHNGSSGNVSIQHSSVHDHTKALPRSVNLLQFQEEK